LCFAHHINIITLGLMKNLKHFFGWMGAICLLAIIPIKVVRWAGGGVSSYIIGIAPSLLGPAGLLFLLLSGKGRLSKLALWQLTLIVATIALGLEFAQLIPRPGILAAIRYRFDWLDVGASLASVLIGYVVAFYLQRRAGLKSK
jgi:hypothetical protein